MIGLVIVSHSHRLAVGVSDIANQMAGDSVKIVPAGGITSGDGEYHLGTDVLRISHAIEDAWSEEGVLLLMDLGSAVMSTEMAVEMLPSEKRSRCLLSNAPLVEGAIVAALQASLGFTLEEVNAAAEDVLKSHKIVR